MKSMKSRLVLAAILSLASAGAFGAPAPSSAARADVTSSPVNIASLPADLGALIPQGAVTLTPTATLTATPSASASPTVLTTIVGGGGSPVPPGPPPGTVPTLSAGMLTLLALGLATVAVLLIRRV
jgi:hypothetical protein